MESSNITETEIKSPININGNIPFNISTENISNNTLYLNLMKQFQQELESFQSESEASCKDNSHHTNFYSSQGIAAHFVDLIIAIAGKFPSMTPCVISLLASIISSKINPDCVNHFACRLICNILGFNDELEVKMMPFIAQNLSICCKAVAGMLFSYSNNNSINNNNNNNNSMNSNISNNNYSNLLQNFHYLHQNSDSEIKFQPKTNLGDHQISQIQNSHNHIQNQTLQDASSKSRATSNKNRNSKEKCTNCGVDKTTLWRRGPDNELVCNACGLYFRLHRVKRPISMKQGIIRTRRRRINEPNSNAPTTLTAPVVSSFAPTGISSSVNNSLNNQLHQSSLNNSYMHNNSNGSNGSPVMSESDSHSDCNIPLNLSISPVPSNHCDQFD